MSPSTATTDERERVGRQTLRQDVISRILSAVFQGRIHSGQRLVVQRLAEQYGVSPTPVREALVELAGLGIVALLPNRGAVVRPFGPHEVREISQVRRVLEVEATPLRRGAGQSRGVGGTRAGIDPTIAPSPQRKMGPRGPRRRHLDSRSDCGRVRQRPAQDRNRPLLDPVSGAPRRISACATPGPAIRARTIRWNIWKSYGRSPPRTQTKPPRRWTGTFGPWPKTWKK